MQISFGSMPSHLKDHVHFGINYQSFNDEVDDGECTSIYGINILDYVPEYDLDKFLDSLVKKMRHKCELVLGGSDVYETAKCLLRGDFTARTINQELYGNKDTSKLGQYSLNMISMGLAQRGLKIQDKQIDGTTMYVKAIRE